MSALLAAVALLASTDDHARKTHCPEVAISCPPVDPADPPVPCIGAHGEPLEIEPPRVRTKAEANYPTLPKALQGIQAKVVLQGTIDVEGNVGDIKNLVCGLKKGDRSLAGEDERQLCPHFIGAAELAWSRANYYPALRGNSPVCVLAVMRFEFVPE